MSQGLMELAPPMGNCFATNLSAATTLFPNRANGGGINWNCHQPWRPDWYR